MTYRKYRKKVPPKRWCASCGTFVGRRWTQRVLCTFCMKTEVGAEPGWTREGRYS